MTDDRRNPPGYITIARHGEPDADRRELLTWRDYERWWANYDLAGLKPGQTAPDCLRAQAREAKTVFASTLPRAIETARAATGGDEFITDPVFVEAPLPPPGLPGRFRSKTWGVYARCAWWLGMARDKETRPEAEARAALAAEQLVRAAQEGSVALFAHGWFNRMLRPELKSRGWVCVRDGGDDYWSWRRYEFKAVSGRDDG
jgi:broad specificity phosphatase PhoE